MMNVKPMLGSHDFVMITLDTLRFDVAHQEYTAGRLPNLSRVLPEHGWEKRHSPASFTYAAHHAFFAGFLPTPVSPGPHPRLFALAFPGSETTGEQTLVFDAPDIISGFRQQGYYTVCVGGVGFFNKRTPLGRVLPDLFDESHWSEAMGVTAQDSTAYQVRLIRQSYARWKEGSKGRVFLFLNISALHQPNCYYVPGQSKDNLDSHAAALRYVDMQLGSLFEFLSTQGNSFCVLCSDHGTAYGDDDYHGHRLGHSSVWDVPYAQFELTTQS
ncbi:MAG: STM4013/SEN3800 family hydrolase [Gammaproteobacteria bacterium]|nr:STM4013/SEN3800 family hydrolase [Gammaproteobacteria bacterium]MDH5803106.1 STM4013/SEN3800 family hydrolase [Gammaproteobacteria bacterium]